MLDAARRPLGVELHDAEVRISRPYRSYAELRGLLHDQIHRVALGQRLDERESERRLGQRVERRAKRELRAAALQHVDARMPLRAASVERHEVVAALQAQDVTEIVRLALVEDHLVAAEIALNIQTRHAPLANFHRWSRQTRGRPALAWYIVEAGFADHAHFSSCPL